MKLKLVLVILALTTVSANLVAQINSDPYKNRIILKYYNKQELLNIETNFPQKFTQLKNYFIHSFVVESIPCTACQPINLSLVDVKEFESQRLPDASITITDTNRGFKITLISKRQLEILNNSNLSPVHVDGIKSSYFNLR